MQTSKSPNRLINESSPYLLQHAHNPVEWYPWGNEALEKAQKEDKPIIVSIGYSACHWCHVMERECFEKEDLAKLMNESFVCIKVDREERPDIDQIYMDAVQAMGIQGGWPLNVFLTSEAKPFYGGTYFPPQHWAQILGNVSKAYSENRKELEESALKFTEYLSLNYSEKYKLVEGDQKYTITNLHKIFSILSSNFDRELGGMNRAPKFPMPNIYLFLLRYYSITANEEALAHVFLTLNEMAAGGIYDQIGGGFARYSVDAEWFAPHFEKMLYDNAQLLTLYAEAYTISKNPRYKEVAFETIQFLERELMNAKGGFYSALDADSEGMEGKFYVWQKDELDELLNEDVTLFADYYNVHESGNWEHNFNILNTTETTAQFAQSHGISESDLTTRIAKWKTILMDARAKRIRPGLDDKILTSWNGLILKGLSDAYTAFHDEHILQLAEKNAVFIMNKLKTGSQLWHSYKDSKENAAEGKASIVGYLEDYATVVEGLLALYQSNFDEQYLFIADELVQYTIEHFYDKDENLFYFTDDTSEKLIARKKELFDNVISSSNSVMATNLYFLGTLLDRQDYLETSHKMLAKVEKLVISEPAYLSNWASLITYRAVPTLEIAIVGEELFKFKKQFDQHLIPNKVVCGTRKESKLPLLQDREAIDGKTTIYVCFNKACKKPVLSVEEALEQISEIEVAG